MISTMKKIGWWLDSVRGLRAHVGIYRYIRRAAEDLPPGTPRDRVNRQMRQQQAMIGSCLLSVLLIHPVGSGRFWD